MKIKVTLIIITLVTLAGTVYAQSDSGTLEKIGMGYVFDVYAIGGGGVVTVSIDNIDGNYRLVFAFHDSVSGEAQCRRFQIPPSYYERLGRPDVITKLDGQHLHAWLTWDEQEHYLYYYWQMPLYHGYVPSAIQE